MDLQICNEDGDDPAHILPRSWGASPYIIKGK